VGVVLPIAIKVGRNRRFDERFDSGKKARKDDEKKRRRRYFVALHISMFLYSSV
jgi:hypothetical protein